MATTIFTKTQIQQAWDWAAEIDGKDSNKFKHDLLGAEIHFDKYNIDDLFGWCIEYIISPQTLAKYGINNISPFCPENVITLFVGNADFNKNNPQGEYAAKYVYEHGRNKDQFVQWIYRLSKDGINNLQKIFGLTDEQMKEIFKYY